MIIITFPCEGEATGNILSHQGWWPWHDRFARRAGASEIIPMICQMFFPHSYTDASVDCFPQVINNYHGLSEWFESFGRSNPNLCELKAPDCCFSLKWQECELQVHVRPVQVAFLNFNETVKIFDSEMKKDKQVGRTNLFFLLRIKQSPPKKSRISLVDAAGRSCKNRDGLACAGIWHVDVGTPFSRSQAGIPTFTPTNLRHMISNMSQAWARQDPRVEGYNPQGFRAKPTSTQGRCFFRCQRVVVS